MKPGVGGDKRHRWRAAPYQTSQNDRSAPQVELAVAVVDVNADRSDIDAFGVFGEKVNVSVVIPTLNEAENLPHVLPRIPAGHEVVLVDGRSTDDTVAVARRLPPRRRDRRRSSARARATALRDRLRGLAPATSSSRSTPTARSARRRSPLFVAALCDGADFVKGSRFQQGGGSTDFTWTARLGNAAPRAASRTRSSARATRTSPTATTRSGAMSCRCIDIDKTMASRSRRS